MSIPAIIILALSAIRLLISTHLHGKPKVGKHNFEDVLIDTAITLLILYWGGFFTTLN